MRELQQGAKLTFEAVIPPESSTMETLQKWDCFISATDLFGVTVFSRIAHIISKLDEVLLQRCKEYVNCVLPFLYSADCAKSSWPNLLRRLDDKYDDHVYYRGHKYLNIITDASPLVANWLENPRDWRTLPVPTACKYSVNPFLRRLGKYVA